MTRPPEENAALHRAREAWFAAYEAGEPLGPDARARLDAVLATAAALVAALDPPSDLHGTPGDLDELERVLEARVGRGLRPRERTAIGTWCLDLLLRAVGRSWTPAPPPELGFDDFFREFPPGSGAMPSGGSPRALPPLPLLVPVSRRRSSLRTWFEYELAMAHNARAQRARYKRAEAVGLDELIRGGLVHEGARLEVARLPEATLVVTADGGLAGPDGTRYASLADAEVARRRRWPSASSYSLVAIDSERTPLNTLRLRYLGQMGDTEPEPPKIPAPIGIRPLVPRVARGALVLLAGEAPRCIYAGGLRRHLEGAGFRVEDAAGEAAIVERRMAEPRPSVILMCRTVALAGAAVRAAERSGGADRLPLIVYGGASVPHLRVSGEAADADTIVSMDRSSLLEALVRTVWPAEFARAVRRIGNGELVERWPDGAAPMRASREGTDAAAARRSAPA